MIKSSAFRPESTRRFTGFVVVGLISTVCNLASRYLFEVVASYEVALAGANIVGLLGAFFLNRWLVFKSRAPGLMTELARFTLVNLAGIVIAWIVAVLLYEPGVSCIGLRLDHGAFVAHAIGIAVPVVPNYLAHRFWTFKG